MAVIIQGLRVPLVLPAYCAFAEASAEQGRQAGVSRWLIFATEAQRAQSLNALNKT